MRIRGRAVVARIAVSTIARHRRDHASGYFSNASIGGVRDVQVPCAVHRDAIGVTQLSVCGRPVIAPIPVRPIAGDRSNYSARYLPYPKVLAIANVEIARVIVDCDTSGVIQLCSDSRSIIALITAGAVARGRW